MTDILHNNKNTSPSHSPGGTTPLTDHFDAAATPLPSGNGNLLQRVQTVLYDTDTRALASVTIDGTITSWNGAASLLLGYTAKEIAGSHLSMLFPPDKTQDTARILDTIYRGEALREFPSTMVRSDGIAIEAELNATPVRDEQGHVDGLALVIGKSSINTIPDDVSARYKGFLQNFKGMAFRLTLTRHPVIIVGAIKEITGYSASELTSGAMSWNDLVHPDDLAYKSEQDDLMRRTPFKGWECEYRIVTKNSEIRWVHENSQTILDKKGLPSHIEGSLYDVTLRRRAEESLKFSEEKYRLLFDNLYDAAFLSDHKTGMIVEMNKKCGTLFNVPRHEMRSISDIPVTGTDGEESSGEFMRHINEHMSVSYESEAVIRNDNGDTYPALVMAQAFMLGSRRLVLWILHDLSHQKKMQEQAIMHQRQLVQADKMASLGILVSGVAHEVNNPNQFIMLNVTTLRKMFEDALPILSNYYEQNGDYVIGGMMYSESKEQVHEIFDEIIAGSARIKHIVSELRDYASDRPLVEAGFVDMNAIVKSAVSLLGNMIRKSSSCFSVEYGDVPMLNGNYQRLEQVVINIIQNACQSLPSKDRAITVITSFNRAAQCVVCTIADEGIGMTEDVRNHIFDPFFTTKRDSGGTGLGLSISSSIVHEHKGRLEFASSPDNGTTATLILPVAPEPAATAQEHNPEH